MLCKTCLLDKDSSMFYISNKTRCKTCITESVKKNRLEKIDYYRSFDKRRASLPHRVAARKEYAATEAYAKSHKAANARWSERHPDRRKASHTVNNAVRDGRLIRQPCWCCGQKAQAHHPDYSRPLDVVWLCPKHHKETHALVANDTNMEKQA